MYPALPNNRLILNGHNLYTGEQLLAYVAKRLNVSSCKNTNELIDHLSYYKNLTIAIRHADTFLKHESSQIRRKYVDLLQKLGKVIISGTLFE